MENRASVELCPIRDDLEKAKIWGITSSGGEIGKWEIHVDVT